MVRAGGLLRRQGSALPSVVLLLAKVSLRLRHHGYNQTRTWLDRRSADVGSARATKDRSTSGGPSDSGAGNVDQQIESARELAFIVRLAARAIPDATCLRKALVLQHLLSERGVPATVQFGARRTPEDSELSFHAWVEVHQQVVSEESKAVAGYTILMDRPPRTGDEDPQAFG